MTQPSGLTVRQFERRDAELPVEFVIDEHHRRQVAFTGSSGLSDTHIVDGVSIDFSPGGAGLALKRFLPRGTRGVLRVLDPESTGRNDDGSPRHEVIFEQPVSVRRVTLLNHTPTYFTGASFVRDEPASESAIIALLERIGRLSGPVASVPSSSGGSAASDAPSGEVRRA